MINHGEKELNERVAELSNDNGLNTVSHDFRTVTRVIFSRYVRGVLCGILIDDGVVVR